MSNSGNGNNLTYDAYKMALKQLEEVAKLINLDSGHSQDSCKTKAGTNCVSAGKNG